MKKRLNVGLNMKHCAHIGTAKIMPCSDLGASSPVAAKSYMDMDNSSHFAHMAAAGRTANLAAAG